MKLLISTLFSLFILTNASGNNKPGKLKLTWEKHEKGIKLAIYKKQEKAAANPYKLAEAKMKDEKISDSKTAEELIVEKRAELSK